ncbi:hypothetical protein IQ06DRAFT_292197 [Phaeosphaeriaceae sp. SRC1lsM3a]|nr:hypothetical protein IQ06DRAFT_292197 [Stagonospora sp. SRC1lsM3a]
MSEKYPITPSGSTQPAKLDNEKSLKHTWTPHAPQHPHRRSWTKNPLLFVSFLAIGTSVFLVGVVLTGVAAGVLQ